MKVTPENRHFSHCFYLSLVLHNEPLPVRDVLLVFDPHLFGRRLRTNNPDFSRSLPSQSNPLPKTIMPFGKVCWNFHPLISKGPPATGKDHRRSCLNSFQEEIIMELELAKIIVQLDRLLVEIKKMFASILALKLKQKNLVWYVEHKGKTRYPVEYLN